MIGSRAWRLEWSLGRKLSRAVRASGHAAYRRYLDSVPRSFARPVGELELLALDLETDGLDPQQSSILQVGFVPLRLGVDPAGGASGISLAGAGQVLVAGSGALDASSVVVHGITDERSADGVSLEAALERTLDALHGRVLVAHCASVERSFLDRACRRVAGAPFVGATICTLELERRWFPGPRTADGLRLGKLRSSHQLPHYPAHDALSDALACAELLLAQVARRRSRDLQLVDLIERV